MYLLDLEEKNNVICRKVDGTGDYYVKRNKLYSDKYCIFSLIYGMWGKRVMKLEGGILGKRNRMGERSEKVNMIKVQFMHLRKCHNETLFLVH
jgi:hypothetical protein